MNIVTVDWECYYDDALTLKKMGVREYVAKTTEHGVALKIDDYPPEWFTPYEFSQLAPRIWKGSNNDPLMLSHNARFDGAVCAWKYGVYPPLYIDTMAMARALIGLYTDKGSVSLNECASHFNLPQKVGGALEATKGKHLHELTLPEAHDFIEYAKHDAWLAYEIYKKLRQDFPQDEYHIVDTTLRMYLQPQFVLNKQVMTNSVQHEVLKKKEVVRQTGIPAATFRSRKKFAMLLSKHGVEVPLKNSPTTGKHTYAFAKTDPGMIGLLNHSNPTVRALAEGKLILSSSIDETRAAHMEHLSRQFSDLSVPLMYYGTHTGRYAGDEKINVLNFPRESPIRKGIQAPSGYKVVSADLEQIEARLVAWWSGQTDLIANFRAKIDVYALFASGLCNRTITKENNPKERFTGKLSILQLGYGASASKFLNMLVQNQLTSMDDGGRTWSKQIVDYYRQKYRHIPKAWTVCDNYIQNMMSGRASGHITPIDYMKQDFYPNRVTLPNKMNLQYPRLQIRAVESIGIWGAHSRWQTTYSTGKGNLTIYGAKLFENICQALARIVIMEMMLKINQLGVRPALQIHDALVWVVADEDIKDFIEAITNIMSTSPWWAPSLPLGVEVKVSDHL